LTNISVDQRNSAYISVGGVLFDKSGRTLVCYPSGKRGAYTIPSSVKTIGPWAFSTCYYLTSVIIPATVETIKEYAFSHCRSLTNIDIPYNYAIVIEEGAFARCYELASVTIPPSVTAIGREAFIECKLTSVTISRSTRLAYSVFDNAVQIQYRD
jgi:hypothetical protein